MKTVGDETVVISAVKTESGTETVCPNKHHRSQVYTLPADTWWHLLELRRQGTDSRQTHFAIYDIVSKILL